MNKFHSLFKLKRNIRFEWRQYGSRLGEKGTYQIKRAEYTDVTKYEKRIPRQLNKLMIIQL